MTKMLLNQKNSVLLKVLTQSGAGSIGIIGPIGAGKGYYSAQLAKNALIKDKIVEGQDIHKLDVASEDVGIEEIRSLQKKLSYKTTSDDIVKQVVIVEHFGILKREAQNAMLKTLEEPPTGTLIIITIDDINLVLPTVLSRLNIVNLEKVELQASYEYFETVPREDVKKAYLVSGGLAGLQDSILNDKDNELLNEISRAKELLRLDRFSRLSKVDKMSKEDRNQSLMFVEGLIKVLKVLHIQNIENHKKYNEIKVSLQRLKLVYQCKEDLSKGLNQKLALTQLFLSF